MFSKKVPKLIYPSLFLDVLDCVSGSYSTGSLSPKRASEAMSKYPFSGWKNSSSEMTLLILLTLVYLAVILEDTVLFSAIYSLSALAVEAMQAAVATAVDQIAFLI